MNITHGNILAVFFSANESERYDGTYWYSRAHQLTNRLAAKYDVSSELVAGVIAALSPNNKWERNILDAENMIRAYKCGDDLANIKVGTFGRNKSKAQAILQGTKPDNILGGLKVRAFFECIAYPSCESVCVDGHAYSIWTGQRVPTSRTPSISTKLYQHIASDYKIATDQINQITQFQYLPSQVQAITWVAWRNLVKG